MGPICLTLLPSFLLQSPFRAAHSLPGCQIPDLALLWCQEFCWESSPSCQQDGPCWRGSGRNFGWQLLGLVVSSDIPVDVKWKTSKPPPAIWLNVIKIIIKIAGKLLDFPAVLANLMIYLLLHGRVFLSASFPSRPLATSTPVNEAMPGPGSDIKCLPAPGRILVWAPRQGSGVGTDTNPQSMPTVDPFFGQPGDPNVPCKAWPWQLALDLSPWMWSLHSQMILSSHKPPSPRVCCSSWENITAGFWDIGITIYFRNENQHGESPKNHQCSSKRQMVPGLQHMEADPLPSCSQLFLGFHRKTPAGVRALAVEENSLSGKAKITGITPDLGT